MNNMKILKNCLQLARVILWVPRDRRAILKQANVLVWNTIRGVLVASVSRDMAMSLQGVHRVRAMA